MKKFDKSWWKFSLRYDPHYWLYIRTPLGRVGVDKFGEQYRTGFSRGRCQERQLRIPLSKHWQVIVDGRGKSYLELVDGPKYLTNTDWILDEFDSSFNDLAIASLRYHMDHAVTYCNDERRKQYQDLVDRLAERRPRFTAAEMDVLHPPGEEFDIERELQRISEDDPVRDAIYAAQRERENAYHDRIRQARHDFIDVLPGLWS